MDAWDKACGIVFHISWHVFLFGFLLLGDVYRTRVHERVGQQQCVLLQPKLDAFLFSF